MYLSVAYLSTDSSREAMVIPKWLLLCRHVNTRVEGEARFGHLVDTQPVPETAPLAKDTAGYVLYGDAAEPKAPASVSRTRLTGEGSGQPIAPAIRMRVARPGRRQGTLLEAPR